MAQGFASGTGRKLSEVQRRDGWRALRPDQLRGEGRESRPGESRRVQRARGEGELQEEQGRAQPGKRRARHATVCPDLALDFGLATLCLVFHIILKEMVMNKRTCFQLPVLGRTYSRRQRVMCL